MAASEPVAVKEEPLLHNEDSWCPGSNHWSPAPRLIPHPSESWALPPASCTSLIVGWFVCVCVFSLSVFPYWQTFAATLLHLQEQNELLASYTWSLSLPTLEISQYWQFPGWKMSLLFSEAEVEESIRCPSIALQQIYFCLGWNIINKRSGKKTTTKPKKTQSQIQIKSRQIEEGLRNHKKSWWLPGKHAGKTAVLT